MNTEEDFDARVLESIRRLSRGGELRGLSIRLPEDEIQTEVKDVSGPLPFVSLYERDGYRTYEKK